MRIVHGRGSTPRQDRELTRRLVEEVADGEPILRVWCPHRQVAFGRRDSNRPGYDRARKLAEERDFVAVDRSVGGHAVCYTGNTVSFVRAMPVDELRSGITERYERTTGELQSALSELGVSAHQGEPDGAFCPGTHSLSAGGKIVGLAQRVTRETAVVAGIVVVRDHEEIGDVLAPVYDALDIPFERDATGSIAGVGGESSPETVVRTLSETLSGGEGTVERIGEIREE